MRVGERSPPPHRANATAEGLLVVDVPACVDRRRTKVARLVRQLKTVDGRWARSPWASMTRAAWRSTRVSANASACCSRSATTSTTPTVGAARARHASLRRQGHQIARRLDGGATSASTSTTLPSLVGRLTIERSVTPDDRQAVPEPRCQFDHVHLDHHVHTILASGLASKPVDSGSKQIGLCRVDRRRHQRQVECHRVIRGPRLKSRKISADLIGSLVKKSCVAGSCQGADRQICKPDRNPVGAGAVSEKGGGENGLNTKVDVGIAIAPTGADRC
jgi:hypothetical protein